MHGRDDATSIIWNHRPVNRLVVAPRGVTSSSENWERAAEYLGFRAASNTGG